LLFKSFSLKQRRGDNRDALGVVGGIHVRTSWSNAIPQAMQQHGGISRAPAAEPTVVTRPGMSSENVTSERLINERLPNNVVASERRRPSATTPGNIAHNVQRRNAKRAPRAPSRSSA